MYNSLHSLFLMGLLKAFNLLDVNEQFLKRNNGILLIFRTVLIEHFNS